MDLANVRIGSPCQERWADMIGDQHVRLCSGCDRQVFNLSEMTRDQAAAVLATRGIKPCVRFYRRADGTVKTADCPPRGRRSKRLTVIAGTLLAASPALADPAPPAPEEVPPEQVPAEDVEPMQVAREPQWEMGDIVEPTPAKRDAIEWSTWARAGYGIGSRPSTLVARTTTPSLPESTSVGEGALGLDVSVAVTRRGAVRLGAWAEWRTSSEPVLGGELIVGGIPTHLGTGSMGVVLRGGGNGEVVTGALGLGYSAADPWLGLHHNPGVRIVTSMTRSVDDPRNWSVTLGLELDPIGALAYFVRAR